MKGLIESAIAVAIVVGSTLIVLNSISPLIQQGKSNQGFTQAKDTLSQIDQTIQQLMVESVGARREINVNVPEGKLIVAGNEGQIKIRIPGFTLAQAGSTVQEGNIQVRGGGTITALEEDINSDGNTDLVLKNDALTFAIQKIGNSTNWASINTSSMITEIFNARTNSTMYPGSGIYINDLPGTSYGTGYTLLTNEGSNIDSSEIYVFVNSTAGITYVAHFSLASGQDFIQMHVDQITGV